jgi:hypothetical protein
MQIIAINGKKSFAIPNSDVKFISEEFVYQFLKTAHREMVLYAVAFVKVYY